MALPPPPTFNANFPDALPPAPQERPWRSWLRSGLRISAVVFGIIVIASSVTLFFWLKTLGVFSLDANRIKDLERFSYTDNTLVFDRDGHKIGEFFDRYQVFVPFEELPTELRQAIIAIEDRTFMQHKGVDVNAMMRAAWSRIKTGRVTQGGSTITQQVVKQMILTNEKTIERKVLEIAWALKLEKALSKKQILQIYTNNMFLGNGAYGVGAAALRYFGKDVRKLDTAECALIAGLFQSPSRYNPAKYPKRAKLRQQSVLKSMAAAGYINRTKRRETDKEILNYKEYKPINYETAPWFVDSVREVLPQLLGNLGKRVDGRGLRVYTTLDAGLQTIAERSIASSESQFTHIEKSTDTSIDRATGQVKPPRIEAAMLITDPKSGEILAMVGGRNYKDSQFNRAMNASRSPGSAFKPIVYTEALMHGFSWNDVIYVSPVNIGNYKPRTPDDEYLSETTMLRAFYKSMNTPTVEIANRLGLPSILNRAKSLGIRTSIKPEFGSVLGSSDTTMQDLARLYNVFASNGMLTELSTITKVTNSDGTILYQAPDVAARRKKVLTPQISYLMTQGMKAVMTRGTASRSSDLANVAAGKTGTSNDSEDNWFCGYTANLSAIVWVGTDEHVPIFASITGGAVALPIWDTFMRQAFKNHPPGVIPTPDGVTTTDVHPLYGHHVTGGTPMWFLEGTQPKQTVSALENIESKGSGAYRRVFRH